MKRLFITAMLSIAAASGALAADLPAPAPAPQAAAAYVPAVGPVYNWGGIYAGINGGYGFGTSSWNDPANPSAGSSTNFSTDGGLIGGTIGANFQANAWVFGVEGDFDWQGLTGSSSSAFCTSVLGAALVPAGLSCKTESNWLGTLRGRVGYAADRLLFFATAGGALGNVETALSGLSSQSTTNFGWTAGAGVEVAFADNWTAKLEYLYVDLGTANCNQSASCGFDSAAPLAANDSVKFTENLVRVGVNYKFEP